MANFLSAFQKVLKHEGGYVNDPSDPGGETYKGVARQVWSKWDGWPLIDAQKQQPGFPASLDKNADLQEKIEQFYHSNYWDRVRGDLIKDDNVATSLFDFAVNAGAGTSVSLTQMVIGVEADGVLGDESIEKLNALDPGVFLASYTVAKIARYVNIVKKRPASQKYFYGWVCRALGDI